MKYFTDELLEGINSDEVEKYDKLWTANCHLYRIQFEKLKLSKNVYKFLSEGWGFHDGTIDNIEFETKNGYLKSINLIVDIIENKKRAKLCLTNVKSFNINSPIVDDDENVGMPTWLYEEFTQCGDNLKLEILMLDDMTASFIFERVVLKFI